MHEEPSAAQTVHGTESLAAFIALDCNLPSYSFPFLSEFLRTLLLFVFWIGFIICSQLPCLILCASLHRLHQTFIKHVEL